MRPLDALTRHASSWGWLVTISAFALLTAGLVMVVWWAATIEERTGTYIVRGTVNGITLDIGDADLQIVGGGAQAALQVRRTDRFAFGHPAEAERDRPRRHAAPALALPGGADRQLLVLLPPARARQRACHGEDHERQRVAPAATAARPASTPARGDVDFDGWCGFNLQIRADVGRRARGRGVLARAAAAALAPGPVEALVPPGRYRVDAESDEGKRSVRGVTTGDDAPFQIQALSTTGDVSVGSGP